MLWLGLRIRQTADGYAFAFSRRDAPELCMNSFAPKEQRAQGRPGARCTRGLVCKMHKANAHEHTGSAESIRPSLRDGFTAYNGLSPVTGLCCHRRPREAFASQELDTSVGVSGPHDFAVRIQSRSSRAPPRPPHPAPNVRDDREAPLFEGRGMARAGSADLPDGESEIFFANRLDNSPDGQVVPRVADDEGPRHYSMKRAAAMLRPSLLEGSVVTACRPSWSSCQFRPRSSS